MGRCRLGHTKTFRVQQGKGRHGAQAGLARGLWLLLVIVLATPGADPPSVSAGEAPAAGMIPTIPAGEVPAAATGDPPSLATSSGGTAIRYPFRPVRIPPSDSPARGFTGAVVGRARYRCARMMRRYGRYCRPWPPTAG